jgi:hypothetical protein
LVWRINVAFSMLVFTMRSTTLFLMNPHFFILVMCMWCLVTVVVSLHTNQLIHWPWSLFCFQIELMFQCPMVRLNWCLCV